jgi:hypothetical protein
VASDSTYQGLNLINGTGSNLGIEFSEKTASRMDVASIDLRSTTAGLHLKNPGAYTETEVVGVVANAAHVGVATNAEISNRYLTTSDTIDLTWNAGAATFRAGETVQFTYGTGGTVDFFIGTAADLALADGGTVSVNIYSTNATATTDTIYAMATSTRMMTVGFAAHDRTGNNATNIAGNVFTSFAFTYQGNNAITLTTADQGLVLTTGADGKVSLFMAEGDSLVITAGEVVTLSIASDATAGSGFLGVTMSQAAYLVATGLQVATGFLATADSAAYTQAFGIALHSANLTTLTAGDFNLTTASNVAVVQAGNTDQINRLLTELNTALTTLRTQSQVLGTNVALLNTRLEFTEDYVNTLQVGADKMTLADINVEGANLLALQTRQQLGIQSLSLAAQAEASILRLFG